MLRRAPTTIHLEQEDVADLIADLEEEKLQLQLQSQRKNLLRTSTENNYNDMSDISSNSINQESHRVDNGVTHQLTSLFQTSPIVSPKVQSSINNASQGNKSSTNNSSSNLNPEFNPFYTLNNQ